MIFKTELVSGNQKHNRELSLGELKAMIRGLKDLGLTVQETRFGFKGYTVLKGNQIVSKLIIV